MNDCVRIYWTYSFDQSKSMCTQGESLTMTNNDYPRRQIFLQTHMVEIVLLGSLCFWTMSLNFQISQAWRVELCKFAAFLPTQEELLLNSKNIVEGTLRSQIFIAKDCFSVIVAHVIRIKNLYLDGDTSRKLWVYFEIIKGTQWLRAQMKPKPKMQS